MKGYVANIEKETEENENFRKVLYTAKFSQLVVMAIPPMEEIGEETHTLDQFIRIEKGTGKAILDDVESQLEDGFAVVVPAGTKHNFVNTSESEPMKLYTIYSPPEHRDGTVHTTKADAMADTADEFEGKTTE
jgi:mannose-6-phosphate isomerase-like protein (cupin superfamily)